MKDMSGHCALKKYLSMVRDIGQKAGKPPCPV